MTTDFFASQMTLKAAKPSDAIMERSMKTARTTSAGESRCVSSHRQRMHIWGKPIKVCRSQSQPITRSKDTNVPI